MVVPGATGPAASTWPVIGRAEEIELLVEAVSGPTGGAVVVMGAAGVGKTRLVRETASRLEAQGRAVRRLAGISTAAMPFGALAPYLPADFGTSEPAALVGHAARVLAMPARAGRALVLVDDAHLLDHPSALVVSQLLQDAEVDVIAAWRSGEHPAALEWVLHDDASVVIELQPLGFDDVAILLETVLGDPVPDATKQAFYRYSGGSVLFLRELVEDAHATDALVETDEGWTLSPGWTPGARVTELVARRIGRRDDREQAVLEALGVAEPVPLDVLGAIAGTEAVVSLERAHLVEVTTDRNRAEVRFAHPLYGEAVRSRLGRAAARQRVRSLADALAATGLRRRGDLLTLARWRVEGGGDLEAEQWAVAAKQACALESPEAEAITRRAVDAGAGAAAWSMLGELLGEARDLDAALDAFERGAAVATRDEERAQLAIGKARALSWLADRTDEALAHLDHVDEQLRDDQARVQLASYRATVLVNAGRLDAGLARIDALLAREHVPLDARINAGTQRAIALAFLGHTDEARQAADVLLQDGLRIGDDHPDLLAIAASPSLIVRLIAGELQATAALLDRFRPAARGVEAMGYVAALDGRLALMQGRARRARDCLLVAREHLAHTMARARSRWVDALLDEAAAMLGLPPERVEGVAVDPGGDLAHRFLVVDALRALAAAHVLRGDRPTARRLLDEGVRISRETDLVAGEIWLAYEMFRLGGGDEPARMLAARAGRMAGPAGELFPRHAAARVTDDPAELERTAHALADAGFNRCAAGCAAEASRSFRRHGVAAGATRCAVLARRFHEQCEAAPDVDLAELTPVAELTPRERDVVLLAVQGRTNREIADLTSTSTRTVEGHLLRAYRKLGVGNRGELASLLGDEPA